MGNYSSKDNHHPDNTSRNSQNNIPKSESSSSRGLNKWDGAVGSKDGGASANTMDEAESNMPVNDMSDIVPTVFKWEHGGRNVYITGTFNNWDRQIPMHRSGNDFSYVHNLKRGKHAFKFVVDDEWRFAPDQPTVADVEGRVSNFIDVSEFQPYAGDENFFGKSKEQKISNDEFSQVIPDIDEYTKEPLPLPPHLRHIILNKSTASDNPLALPVPQVVSLYHLYCTAIKDELMVLGATQRYKEKYSTIVFYSLMA